MFMISINKGSIHTSKNILIAEGLEEDGMVREVHCPGVQGYQTACLHLKGSFYPGIKKMSVWYLSTFNKYSLTSPCDGAWSRF